jgi:hypothetical protein
MSTTEPIIAPQQMQRAARHKPALTAKLDARETWLVRTFGVPIECRYALQYRCIPAWLAGATHHQFRFTQDVTLDSFLWERACFLTALTLQGEAIQACGWFPYYGVLALDNVRALHRQHGFLKVARSLGRPGRDRERVIARQFKLINRISQVLARTVLHLSLEVRMARDFPEINRHFSPLRHKDWDPVAHAQFEEVLSELLPAKIARCWWSVKAARALLTDRLIGTRRADYFAGLASEELARTIADYCQGAFAQMPPGGEYEIMRRVSRLAGLQDFQNPQPVPVPLFRAAP